MGNNIYSNLHIGIPIIGEQGWLGGITYVELLFKALRMMPDEERPKISLVVHQDKIHAIELHKHFLTLADSIIFTGSGSIQDKIPHGIPVAQCRSLAELASLVDFYYPVNSGVLSEVCSGSWIPDFQHVYLPEFFTPEDIKWRDQAFQNISDNAKTVVLSSRDAEQTFRKLYPHSQASIHILSFHTLIPKEYYEPDPAEVQKRYGLPDNFLICCNQFWAHKNHSVIFEALAQLKRADVCINLVCTGSRDDYRFLGYFSKIQQKLIDLGIKDQVYILGVLPRSDQIQLMRRSMAVIQPSLFEGWSTVVEDSRALGKTIILSDLAVHYEQAADYACYFDRRNPEVLADKIKELLPSLSPGPDTSREQSAQIKTYELAINYAREFCEIALEAQKLCAEKSNNSKSKITIATSIAPKNIEIQKQAVKSWLKLGFSVVSLNCPEEVSELQDQFPEIAFITVYRDARSQTGKPLIYFDDFIRYFKNSNNQVCGIVNSDILLKADPGFASFIESEAKNSILTGCRVDIRDLQTRKGPIYIFGFDYFFFDKSLTGLYPENDFTIGSPWWDYWMLIVPLSKGFSVKQIIPPVGFHLKHELAWKHKIWNKLAENIEKYINEQKLEITLEAGISSELKNTALSHAVQNYIFNNSKNVSFANPSLVLNVLPLKQIDIDTFIRVVQSKELKWKLQTYAIYLKQLFEVSPNDANIYITLIDFLFECRQINAAVSLLHSVETELYNQLHLSYQSTELCEEPHLNDSKENEPYTIISSLPALEPGSIPQVSAIVSAYNSERFMHGCLEDLINQTLYRKGILEIIVVDSGSLQKEKMIVEKFQKQYGRIVYIRTAERESVCSAWNRGIKAARGKYITISNAVDRHRHDALEVMMNALDRNPGTGLVYADAIVTKTENETFAKHTFHAVFRFGNSDKRLLSCFNFIGTQPMWRKSLHDHYSYFDESLTANGDWEFWLRIADDTEMLYIPETLGLCLLSSNNPENKNSEQTFWEEREIQKKYVLKYFSDYESYFSSLIEQNASNPLPVLRLGQILISLDKFSLATDLFITYMKNNIQSESIADSIEYAIKGKIRYDKKRMEVSTVLSAARGEHDNKAFSSIYKSNLACINDSSFIVCAMFTPDTPRLTQCASRLANSCNKFTLPYVIYQIPFIHKSVYILGQDDPVFTKPNFIAFNLQQFNGKNILYLDIDTFFIDYPTQINKISKSISYDFAVYNWLNDTHNDAYYPKNKKTGQNSQTAGLYSFLFNIPYNCSGQLLCNGGVQFYKNSPAVKELLASWQQVIADNPHSSDDECLDFAFNNYKSGMHEIKPFWLDKAYIRLPWWPHIRPVIIHPELPLGGYGRFPVTGPDSLKRFYPEKCKIKSNSPIFPEDYFIDTKNRLLLKIIDERIAEKKSIKQKFWIYPADTGLV